MINRAQYQKIQSTFFYCTCSFCLFFLLHMQSALDVKQCDAYQIAELNKILQIISVVIICEVHSMVCLQV